MNAKVALPFLVVLAAFIVLISWVRQRATAIETANQALRMKVQELEEQLARKSPPVESQAEARAEKLELMRLRNEVTQLRSSNQTLSTVEVENARLLAEVQKLRARPASSSEGQSGIERSQWSFQGYATPEAAYMSAMWALKEGRTDTVLASYTPEERERFETDNQGKSPEEIAERLKSQVGSYSALRVVGQRQVSPTEVVLDTQVSISSRDGSGQSVSQAVRMLLVGNEWKTANPIEQSYDPLAFYRKNPELMRRYFPHLFREGQPERTAAAAAISERYGIVPANSPTPNSEN